MPVEMALWRVDDKPVRLSTSGMPNEDRLESLIERDPGILGQHLLLIGRQVRTDYGGRIDLLAIDADGDVHVLELKRDKTPREVVAQALDYGYWVGNQSNEDIRQLYADYSKNADQFDAAFESAFGQPPPDDINAAHHLTIVASEIDPASERIVEYLAAYGLPVNVLFFRYFVDGDRQYLARTWLLDQEQTADAPAATKTSKTKEPWNGTDWYVSFGAELNHRVWDDAVRFGFVSAGGGAWYSRTLRNLPLGGRVFVCIPKSGYVGVGEVTGTARVFAEATVDVNGVQARLADQPLTGNYTHENGEDEWVVPVRWISTQPSDKPIWKTGMFANQNSAAKLRNRFTLEQLYAAFHLDTADDAEGS